MLSQFPISIGSTQPGLAASLSLGRVLESFRVNLQEGFPAAFKILGFPVVSSGGLAQEDGYPTPGSGVNQGGASQGTRILMQFLNFSGGARVFVPFRVQSGQLEIRRVLNAATDGTGGCIYLSTCLSPPPAGTAGPAQETSNSQFVVYEVTNSDPFNVDQLEMSVYVCHGHTNSATCQSLVSAQGLKNSQVRISLAPLSTVDVSDGPAPEPRFVDIGIPMDVPR